MSDYLVRLYQETDRAAVSALGVPIVEWWYAHGPETALHLVAVSESNTILGDLQATDRSVTDYSRRPGQCHFQLHVTPEHRRRGIGGTLYAHLERFAAQREASLLYVAYLETPEAPAASFLSVRGFTPLERFLPSSLNLTAFDPSLFLKTIEAIERQGIRLSTFAELGDSPENRRKLYGLDQSARATQPFRETKPYIPPPFETWQREFDAWDQTTIFVALDLAEDAWVGVVTGLEWYFTGIHPEWRNRGIATALKVLCLTEAKRRGLPQMETENHEDNAAMLAINRKLGFVFGTPEVACIKRLAGGK